MAQIDTFLKYITRFIAWFEVNLTFCSRKILILISGGHIAPFPPPPAGLGLSKLTYFTKPR